MIFINKSKFKKILILISVIVPCVSLPTYAYGSFAAPNLHAEATLNQPHSGCVTPDRIFYNVSGRTWHSGGSTYRHVSSYSKLSGLINAEISHSNINRSQRITGNQGSGKTQSAYYKMTVSPGSGLVGNNRVTREANATSVNSTKPYKIDTTAPSCNPRVVSGLVNGYASPYRNIVINWGPVDDGCAGVNANSKRDISYPGNAGHAEFTVMDGLVNTRKCTYSWKVDRNRPSCWTFQNPEGWTRGDVTVNASCTDGESGFDSCTSGVATQYGQKVVLKCKDKVGNETTIDRTVTNIDKTAPSCGAKTFPGRPNGAWITNYVPVNVACHDNNPGSGCTQGSYTKDIHKGNGSIEIRDNIGNTSTCDASYDFYDPDK